MTTPAYFTITVRTSELTDALLAQVAEMTGVVSAVRSPDDLDMLVATVPDDRAKCISGSIARMFPGCPVQWVAVSTPNGALV